MIAGIPVINGLLVAGRLAGIFFTAPILGSRNLPTTVRITLIFFMTILVSPLVSGFSSNYEVSSLLVFLLLIGNEILQGLFIGLVMTIYLNFIYFAGDLIDTQLGFSIISVINPLDESQMPITSNLFYVFFSLIFLVLNFHHRLILTMIDSFRAIPIATLFRSDISVNLLFDVVNQSMLIGLKIAAPFMITVVIADIVMGMLSKAMPGMNIFVLGVPFKVLIGLLVFFLIFPILFNAFSNILSEAFDVVFNYLFRVRR